MLLTGCPLISNQATILTMKREIQCLALPRDPSSFHVIGQGNIMWPHIILPLLQTNHTTEDVPRMHSHTHVDIDSSSIPHFPKDKESKVTIQKHPLLPLTVGQFSRHLSIQNFSGSLKYCHRFFLWQNTAALSQEKELFFLVTTRLDQNFAALASKVTSGQTMMTQHFDYVYFSTITYHAPMMSWRLHPTFTVESFDVVLYCQKQF